HRDEAQDGAVAAEAEPAKTRIAQHKSSREKDDRRGKDRATQSARYQGIGEANAGQDGEVNGAHRPGASGRGLLARHGVAELLLRHPSTASEIHAQPHTSGSRDTIRPFLFRYSA